MVTLLAEAKLDWMGPWLLLAVIAIATDDSVGMGAL